MTTSPSLAPRQRVDAWQATHIGLVREKNEDAQQATPARGIFLIADGIGGHPGGEFASSIAVVAAQESLLRSTELPAPALRKAFAYANQRVLEAAERDPSLFRMGCTLVAALILPNEIDIAWCGDSRAYLYRQGSLFLLTEDHGYNGILTACIGDPEKTRCSIRSIATQPGDKLLLCTDGLSSYVDERVIAKTMKMNKEPKPCARALIEEALKVGGRDNVTVTVLRVRDR